jgi:hypothetical protein
MRCICRRVLAQPYVPSYSALAVGPDAPPEPVAPATSESAVVGEVNEGLPICGSRGVVHGTETP